MRQLKPSESASPAHIVKGATRILVAEDDRVLNAILDESLSEAGFEVRCVHDGAQAVAAFSDSGANVLLLDIKMPRLGGFEVLRFVKEHHPQTKVIMLTGYGDLRTAIKAKKLGADAFMSKPYDLDDLLCTIQSVLNN